MSTDYKEGDWVHVSLGDKEGNSVFIGRVLDVYNGHYDVKCEHIISGSGALPRIGDPWLVMAEKIQSMEGSDMSAVLASLVTP